MSSCIYLTTRYVRDENKMLVPREQLQKMSYEEFQQKLRSGWTAASSNNDWYFNYEGLCEYFQRDIMTSGKFLTHATHTNVLTAMADQETKTHWGLDIVNMHEAGPCQLLTAALNSRALTLIITLRLFNVVPSAKDVAAPDFSSYRWSPLYDDKRPPIAFNCTVDWQSTFVDEGTLEIDFTDDPKGTFTWQDKNGSKPMTYAKAKQIVALTNCHALEDLPHADLDTLSLFEVIRKYNIFRTDSMRVLLDNVRKYPGLRLWYKTFPDKPFILQWFWRYLNEFPYGEAMKKSMPLHKYLGLTKRGYKLLIDFIQRNDFGNNMPQFNYFQHFWQPMQNADINMQVQEDILESVLDAVSDKFSWSGIVSNLVDCYGKYSTPGHPYDCKRCIKYITDDVWTYQGISDPQNAMQLLRDYYDMLSDMGIKIDEWFPKSLKLVHDIAAKNHKIHIDEITAQKFATFVSSEPYQQLCYASESSPYIVIAPKTTDDVVKEGRRQNHCVGSYTERIANGETCILFMRKAEEPDHPVLTLQVNPATHKLVQYRGNGNRDPYEKEMEFLHKWAKVKGLEVA